MNPIDINLLTSTDLLSPGQKQLRRKLALVATTLGLLVLASGIVVFGLEKMIQVQVANLQNQQQEQLVSFENNVPKLNKLLSLKDKLAGIKKVVGVRPNLSVAIAAQQALLVDGVATTKMVVGSSGQMSFDVTVKDAKVLSNYLTKLDSDQARSFFKSLIISSLVLGKDGGFVFSVEAQFDPTKLLSKT